MNRMNFRRLSLAAAILGMFAMRPALAQDSSIAVHGFGNQDYRSSTANSYMGADSRGTWDNNLLGLVIVDSITDKSKLWAQIQANTTEQVRATWMFVDYQMSDDLRAHVGRIKFPFGIYNEYIGTKALQMSVVEPIAYSAAADMTYDAYDGFGADYDLHLPGNNTVTVQLFGGNIYNPAAAQPAIAPCCAAAAQNGLTVTPHNDRSIWGGKVSWQTPVDGLRFMFSANEAGLESTAAGEPATLGTMFKEDRFISSIDYTGDRLDLKAELNRHNIQGIDGYNEVDSQAWYVQAGYRIDNWTPYVRYDAFIADKSMSSDPSYYQNTVVVGVNYKLSNSVNLRGEVHNNHGYGMPVIAGETAAGTGTTDWTMYALSANFMF